MNDLISRQAAIEALGEEPEVWSGEDEYEQGLNNQWHYDITAIKAVPSAGQWIPVTERFPKKEEYVLVTETNGNVDIAWLDDIWTEDGEELIWYAGECFRINVTAWMPLPEPWDDGRNYDREFWGDEK